MEMDEENQVNDKLKLMKFSLLPCGLKHTPFFNIMFENTDGKISDKN